MNAIVYADYGPPGVPQIKELDKQVPKDHEVLVRIYAAAGTGLGAYAEYITRVQALGGQSGDPDLQVQENGGCYLGSSGQLSAGVLFEPRGAIDVKGKGRMETCFLVGST